jgi:glycosyltransferase involved in cell wall biosynthesis
MPNALLEAMAAGVPAVAARTGGVPEIMGEEEAGIMVPPGSPEVLADAVIGLLKSSGQREKMKTNAIKRSVLFSLDKMTESYESLYEELLKGRP